MPKAEIGTPKHVAKEMKKRGLHRLRWYCQPCAKQCRDENGFKCHLKSPSHLRKASKPDETDWSAKFESDFIYLLRASHGTKPQGANRFYNEYIQDRDHVHMNATRWSSLTAFIHYLNRKGSIVLTDSEEGPVIAWKDPMGGVPLGGDTSTVSRANKALERQLNSAKAESRNDIEASTSIGYPKHFRTSPESSQAAEESENWRTNEESQHSNKASPPSQAQGVSFSIKLKKQRMNTFKLS